MARQQPPPLGVPVFSVPPEPPPQSLAEFLGKHITLAGGGLMHAEIPSARYTLDLVNAAAEGREPPLLDGLTGRDMYLVTDLIAELVNKSREYPAATPLLCRVRGEYNDRIQIRRHPRQPPIAVRRNLPGPGFRPNPGPLSSPPGAVAKLFTGLAGSAAAASQALRAVAGGRPDAAAGLDARGQAAVTALLDVARREAAAGGDVQVQDLQLIAAEWREWVAAQARREAQAPVSP